MTDPRTRTESVQLLRDRITQSGLSTTEFARQVLRREPSTVRRWLRDEVPIPGEVQRFLERPEPAPWPRDGNDG